MKPSPVTLQQAEQAYARGGPAVAAAHWAALARQSPQDAAVILRWVVCIIEAGGRVDPAAGGDGAAAARRLIVLDPAGIGWAAAGRLALGRGDWAGAVRQLRRTLTVMAQRAQSWGDLANALHRLKAPTAMAAATRAAALAPDHSEYLFNLGCEWQDADRLADAAALFRRALRLAPELADAYARLADMSLLQGRANMTARLLRRALALHPALPAALNASGLQAGRARRAAAALVWYDRALTVDPAFAESRLNRGLEYLQTGRLADGWRDYEQRFASRGYVDRPLPVPRWTGQALAGRRVFVWREQGLGDEILFSACLAALAARAAAVTVECDRRMVGLFARAFPGVRFCAAGGADAAAAAAQADFHLPIGSLPGALGWRLSDFAAGRTAWLSADPARVAVWRMRLDAAPPGLRVGLAWRSGLMTTDRTAAYTRLDDWRPLFALPNVTVVNLQYGDCRDELAAAAAWGGHLLAWPDLDLKDDLEGLAALISGLDLVVTPATAAGELAAALGVPVWRLGAPDWTTLGGAARPWFPAQQLLSPRPGEAMADLPRHVAAALQRLQQPPAAKPAAAKPAANFAAALRFYQAGDLSAAMEQCAALIAAGRADSRCRHLAAVIANRQGRHSDAVAGLAADATQAAAEPAVVATLTAACGGLGAAALATDRPAAAVDWGRRGLALNPTDRPTLVNLAAALMTAGQPTAADGVLRRALTLNAADAAAWSNLALALERQSRDDAALAAYRRALAVDDKHATAHYNAGLLLLRNGMLRQGWAEHDWRFATPQFAGQGRRFAARLWRGENLSGRRLLIWREQGVGDEILFASCYADVIARAGQVIIQCDRRLVSLLARSFPDARVMPANAPPPPHDLHIPAGSLPRWLRSDLARFPERRAWLKPDPARAAQWRRRVEALGPGLKIGVAWRSSLMTSDRRAAYIDALDWAPALRLPGIRWINLQYGDCAAELAAVRRELGVEIAVWDDLDLKNDFEAAAALVSCLDLVITPAMSAGELAGALGVPVWRLGERDWTSLSCLIRPWYPAMQLWAPRRGEALRNVPAAMAQALRRLMTAAPDPAPGRTASAGLPTAAAAFAAGDIATAAKAYRDLLADDPTCAPAWTGLGACFAEAAMPDPALTALRAALALNPADAAALTTAGNALTDLRRPALAAALHERALRLVPGLTPARDNLGVALLALGRDAAAEACHRQVLAADPTAVGAWINLAAALRHQGRPAAARTTLNMALALAPADDDALANLTWLLRISTPNPLADPWMDRAFRRAPQSPAILFNRGVALLAAGELAGGWAGYDQRFRVRALAAAAPALDAPPWMGGPLTGRRLLVWGEQGVGDQMMFASLLPDLLARAAAEGGSVTLIPEPRLAGLFRRAFPGAAVVEEFHDPAVRAADCHCGMGSLGRWLQPRLADFSPQRAWLTADPALVAAWRDRLAGPATGRLRVGLAWRSGLLTGERRREYTDLAAWGNLLALPGVTVVNLLYGAENELAAAAQPPLNFADLDLKNDFEGLAALISNLDLVISPATSVGEMAAALGVPVWRFGTAGDWTRLGTAVRPWFPAQTIFAARPGETLDNVAARLTRRLARLAQ